jgi:hypothetical protein
MDPDIDDPNNHVPSVAPDDEWGDLDGVQDASVQGLPPVRSDQGVLPRKVARKPLVNDHSPKQKSHEQRGYAPVGPTIARRQKEVTTIAKDDHPSPVPDETAPSETSLEPAGAYDGAGESEKVSIPAPQVGKRPRVNQIGTAGEALLDRASKKYNHPDAGTAGKRIHTPLKRRAIFARKRKGEWGDAGSRGSLRWIPYTGLSVIVLVVVTVVLNRPAAPGNKLSEQSRYSQMKPEGGVSENSEEDNGMMGMLTDGQEEAKRIFAKYATATSPADFMGSVHRAEGMAEFIERNWQPLGMKPGWIPDGKAVWSVRDHEGMRYGALEGSLPDFSTYRAFFRQDEAGLKMDWKATVGYCTSDFATLKKGQGDAGEVRAVLSPADFHTFSLPEGAFRSFRLSSPDGEETLWGYVKTGGELDGKLVAQFLPSQITGEALSEIAVILSLARGPDESLPNQWMITNLVRLNWLDE